MRIFKTWIKKNNNNEIYLKSVIVPLSFYDETPIT